MATATWMCSRHRRRITRLPGTKTRTDKARFGPQRVITTAADDCRSVYAADLDGGW